MSTVTGVSNSTSASYATQLAQTSALKRSLSNLGAALQNGDLNSAASILAGFIKANPQYASTTSYGSQSQDPINQDFQGLATAISNGQVDSARSAWTQIKSDLAKAGVTDLSTGPDATTQLLTQTKASITLELLNDTFGSTSGEGASVTSLLGTGADTGSGAALSSSLIGNWLTYQASGTTSPTLSTEGVGNMLNVST